MAQRNSVTFSSRPNHAARHAHQQARQMFSEYDTSQITPKRSKLPMVFAVLISVVVVLAIVGLVMHFFVDSGTKSNDLLPQGQSAQITVVAGDDAALIAAELQRAGLISDTGQFVRRVQALGAESSLQAGTYQIEGGQTPDEIIAILRSGTGLVGDVVVVTEGMVLLDIADAVEVATEGRITAENFIDAAQSPQWVAEFPFVASAGEANLEGMLFPATYPVGVGTTANDLVRQMLSTFQQKTANLDLSYPTAAGLSWYDWLKLASIIQAESAAGDEPYVASVFYNRIATDMPLQSDATTAYVVGGAPTPEDLADYDNPFNTYSYERLGVSIPKPIGNPGLVALEAACSPAKTDYLYFYSAIDAEGEVKTTFSVTLEEHEAAIAADR